MLPARLPPAIRKAWPQLWQKIKNTGKTARHQNTATAHLFFANPLKKGSLMSLFSTHPPIDDRIKRLREMGTHA